MWTARRIAVALVSGLFLVSISSQLTWAAGRSGALDPTFGAGGKVLTDFGEGRLDFAHAMAIQSDGKIVATGNSDPGGEATSDFALSRYNLDGTLDPTFNTTGTVLTDFSGCGGLGCSREEGPWALAIQSDGKIVAAGGSDASSYPPDFALARYLPDGTLDPTFNGTGKVLTDFSIGFEGRDTAYALAIQSDGKIVAAGAAEDANGSSDFALARYNPDGTLDPTFNATGMVLTDFTGSGGLDVALSMAIQPDGKIVAAGTALARYNPDGTLDPTFNATGKVLTDFNARALAIQSDGKIVTAGSSAANGSSDFALARYNPDGTLDPTFNGTGKVLTDFSGSGSGDGALSMAIQSDGKIVAAGSSDASGSIDFALARYRSSGRLDRRFGANGKVLTDFTRSFDDAQALAIQWDGKIVAAGASRAIGTSDFALARYLP
jgi:uncharacterized delta-60 repeat protein